MDSRELKKRWLKQNIEPDDSSYPTAGMFVHLFTCKVICNGTLRAAQIDK